MRRRVRYLLMAILLIFPVVLISLTYLEDIAETNGHIGSEGPFSFLANLPKQVTVVASEAGYLGIFGLMLLEAAALPVPSEIILPFAGFLVSQGTLEFWPVIFISTVAALIGSFIDYYLGWKLGGPLLANQSKIPFVDTRNLRWVGAWFNRYGPLAVALLRLVPAARVLISFPAGIYRMSKTRFALYTLAGCLPWNMVLVYLGWWLGSSWDQVVSAFRYINLIVYALLIVFVVLVGWKLGMRRRAGKR